MAKKKKADIGERRAKSKQEAQKKRKLRLVKCRPRHDVQISHRPGLPHLGAPEGFRSIPFAQAMMEYAKPLMELLEQGGKEAFDDAMQAAMVLWNYALSLEEGHESRKIEKDILKTMRASFDLDETAAQALFTKMIERHGYLFPPDIQPKGSPFMFIRKEVRHIIGPFDYDTLDLSDDIIPPDRKDKALVERINKLDSQISAGIEYDKYESLFLSLKDECQARFERWLMDKGLSQDVALFSDCLHIYFDFIYGYMHDDTITLKSVPFLYFVEFFEDFLLRKMMAGPNEYVYWPPALKLFYGFLQEKGYLERSKKIVDDISKVEPYFIEVLKKQFS
jgi:hypothetical protein